METNESEKNGEKTAGSGSGAELKPKDAVRRILAAAGAVVSDKEAFWLGCHMERFVNHTRKHGELLEFPLAVECYLTFFKQGNPPEWQLDQVKQALVLFGRGTERWRWVRVDDKDPAGSSGVQGKEADERKDPTGSSRVRREGGPKGYVLRYRVKASGVNDTLVSAQGEVSPLGPPVEMEAWIEDLRRALRVSH